MIVLMEEQVCHLMLVPRPRWRLVARHTQDPHMGWGSAGVSRRSDMTVTIWLISRGEKHVKTQVKSERIQQLILTVKTLAEHMR